MKIDEAIEKYKNQAQDDCTDYDDSEDYEQLAEWLEELKELRKEKDKFDRNLKFFNEINKKCCKEGYNAGYSKAENDYHAQSEKDRQSSYDCGYEVGYAKAIDDAKSVVLQTLDNEILVDTLYLRLEQLKAGVVDG